MRREVYISGSVEDPEVRIRQGYEQGPYEGFVFAAAPHDEWQIPAPLVYGAQEREEVHDPSGLPQRGGGLPHDHRQPLVEELA